MAVIRAYIDDTLLYDSRSTSLAVEGLTVSLSLTKGGSATIILPPGHPVRGAGVWFRSILRLEQDGQLIFRGRMLPSSDDLYGRRTMLFEGERCMLLDSLIRPGSWIGTRSEVLSRLLGLHNAEMDDDDKKFTHGRVDNNDTISFAVDEAASTYRVLDDLLAQYGGVITFAAPASTGYRRLNWIDPLPGTPAQEVRVGRNLLSLTRKGSTGLITRLVPYGAADEVSGQRLTVRAVNAGADYVSNPVAEAVYGVIVGTATWDAETDPARLLALAQEQLAESSVPITSLELSFADLSAVDSRDRPFTVGDTVRIVDRSSGLDANMIVTDRDRDLLNPSRDTVKLGLVTRAMSAGYDADRRAEARRVQAGLSALQQRLDVTEGGARYLKSGIDVNYVTGIGAYKVAGTVAATTINRPPVSGDATLTVTYAGRTTYSGQDCSLLWQLWRVAATGAEYTRALSVRASDGVCLSATAWLRQDKDAYSDAAP